MRTDKTKRQLKVGKRIQRVLSEELGKIDLKVNGQNIFLDITQADISPNLRNLRIFLNLSDFDEKQKKEFLDELNKNYSKLTRKVLADKVNLKYVPDVSFALDVDEEKLKTISDIIEEERRKMASDQ